MPKPNNWPPPKPANFEFTPHPRGWAKWYRGQTRVIYLRTLNKSEIRAAWRKLADDIDRRMAGHEIKPPPGTVTVAQVASKYFEWLDHRLATGKPKPISPFTVYDYKEWINRFGRCVGGNVPLESLGPDHFGEFAKMVSSRAPSTVARAVASVHAFVKFAFDEDIIDHMPRFGRYFAKPPRQAVRDVRMNQAKCYSIDEIRRIYRAARPDEKLWVILGLCAAMDNADIAALTWSELDRDAKTIDYRRRKVGKVRRVIPMPDDFWTMLNAHHRPLAADPAWDDRVFLTDTGLPLQRIKRHKIDRVSSRWKELCAEAGLKRSPREKRHADDPPADGRGFRSLRTTFANMAPPGFREEVEIIMGHKTGAVLVDHYIESVGLARLSELVNHVWDLASFTLPHPGACPSTSSTAFAPALPVADIAGTGTPQP